MGGDCTPRDVCGWRHLRDQRHGGEKGCWKACCQGGNVHCERDCGGHFCEEPIREGWERLIEVTWRKEKWHPSNLIYYVANEIAQAQIPVPMNRALPSDEPSS